MVRRRPSGRRYTDSSRRHRAGVIASAIVAVTACGLLGVGAVAWSMPQLEPVKVLAGQPADLGRSPWFDSGTTVFADIDPAVKTRAADWGCRLTDGDSSARALESTPDPDVIGTRVIDDQSLTPVVTVGPTGDGSSITCSGGRAETGVTMWALPTDAGLPRVALSLVIAGIALLGAAALMLPAARGLTRFGR